MDDTCAVQFDLNRNGILDYYYAGTNEEFDKFCELYNARFSKTTNCPQVVQFRLLIAAYRLDPSVNNIRKGATEIKLEGVTNLKSGNKCLFGKNKYEEIEIVSVNTTTNTVTVKPPLAAYDNTDGIRLVRGLSGLATSSFLLVTNDGGDCANVIGHEILHTNNFGHLRDVKEGDNLMHYKRSPGTNMLRFRKQTFYKEEDDGLSGFDQWSDINRVEITEGE